MNGEGKKTSWNISSMVPGSNSINELQVFGDYARDMYDIYQNTLDARVNTVREPEMKTTSHILKD